MQYVYKWWAEWDEFGEKVGLELHFRSHERMKEYSAKHSAAHKNCNYTSLMIISNYINKDLKGE
jgi:hypothetical protein